MRFDREAMLEKLRFHILSFSYGYWGYHEIYNSIFSSPSSHCTTNLVTIHWPCKKLEIMTTRAVLDDAVILTNLRILQISFMFVNHCAKCIPSVRSGGGSLVILLNGK